MKNAQNELRLLADEAYVKFSSYRFGSQSAVHAGICCLSDEEVNQLKKLPIHQVSRSLIHNYLDAGEESDKDALSKQIKYLLPRILELLIEDEYIHHSYECIFDKFRLKNSEVWNKQEIDFMNQFALSFFKSKLFNYDEFNNVSSYLIMFHRAGLDIQILLDSWLLLTSNEIALQNLIKFIYETFPEKSFQNFFADESLVSLMNHWMSKLKSNEVFINALIQYISTDHPFTQDRYMAEVIFDQL